SNKTSYISRFSFTMRLIFIKLTPINQMRKSCSVIYCALFFPDGVPHVLYLYRSAIADVRYRARFSAPQQFCCFHQVLQTLKTKKQRVLCLTLSLNLLDRKSTRLNS